MAVGAATALHFVRQGLFGEFIQFTVLNHFVGMASYEYPSFPSLFPVFGQDPQLRSGAGMASYLPAIVHIFDLSRLSESARQSAPFTPSLSWWRTISPSG